MIVQCVCFVKSLFIYFCKKSLNLNKTVYEETEATSEFNLRIWTTDK